MGELDILNQPHTNQCWYGIVFFLYHLDTYNEDFTFFDTNRVWVFNSTFDFDTIRVYIPCKNLQTEVKLPYYQYALEWYSPK